MCRLLRLLLLWFRHEDFDTTIACATCGIRIAGDRFAAATTVNINALWCDATPGQVITGT
ncbi:hypothetical protein D3C76_1855860 [compost metagenome]